ncbi:hypothetical protein BCR34DRAFT_561293 [Clohesyomyces aquaticus]|uniref:Structure-specific endonuclease subunit SLX4 n=1 Tax=Clohesyomyces aquaticus TaxID=1231657 RepID=A0A1Y1ZUL6_9PLEO|nr:hypothetical protein BCR34DRAFT_561293 [Clohesyomyces aquaticus]
MTTFDLVLLSSSPPASSGLAAFELTPPSNPRRAKMATFSHAAVSPAGSPQRKTGGALKSGSRTSTVPLGAARGFSTADSLVKSHHFNLEPAANAAPTQGPQSRRNSLQDATAAEKPPKQQSKRPTKKTAIKDAAEPKPKKSRVRKPKANKDEDAHNAGTRDTATTSVYFAEFAPATVSESPDDDTNPPAAKSKVTKPRKPRAKKEKLADGDTQAKPKKARTAKAKKVGEAVEKPPRQDTGTVSAHFGNDSIWDVPASPQPKTKAPDRQDEGLQLEDAIARRRDWTPARDTSATEELSMDLAAKENEIMQPGQNNFTHVLSNFAFTHADTQAAQPTAPSADGTTVTKRRRVELVDLPANQSNSRGSSPEKGKAPKKKPRTITDLVTGQYAPQDTVLMPPPVTSDFFEARATTQRVPLNDTGMRDSPERPARKRLTSKTVSEKKTESKSKKSSSKNVAKSILVADKLLSPASAVLRMNRQDILFGTSSQLAKEESPSFIRKIQQAMRESEQNAETLHTSTLLSTQPSALGPGSRLGKIEGKRRLWAASARDDDGQLLEKLDNIYIPEPDHTQDLPLLMDGTVEDPESSFADIDNYEPPAAIAISSDLSAPPPTMPCEQMRETLKDYGQGGNGAHDSSLSEIDEYKMDLPPSNQQINSSFLDIDDFSPATNRVPSVPPASNHISIPMPTPAPSSAPPPKRRGRPPKAQSAIPQQRAIPSSQPKKKAHTKAKVTAPAAPSTPPRKRGRFADIEEIMDSEDDEALSPTPPRIRNSANSVPLDLQPTIKSEPGISSDSKSETKPESKSESESKSKPKPKSDSKPKPPLPPPVPVFEVPPSLLEWETMKHDFFTTITQTVHNLPPSNNPQSPSWHEKILLYDPIILEDFTAWVNTQARIRIWRRAAQKQIKAWEKVIKKGGGVVERRWGFCGGDSGGVGLELEAELGDVLAGEMIKVVEKEVEGWMLQRWCEEMSVCCVQRESRGRGGVRKGLY